MTLEELIYTRLISTPELASTLAKFNGAPAVFYQTAPADRDNGWKGRRQYPRINFVADLQASPERHTTGILAVDVWCEEKGPQPEDLEPVIRAALRDVFVQPDNSPPYSFSWARSEPFEKAEQNSKPIIVTGATVIFDIFAYPTQTTTDPDPIQAINRYAKNWMPDAIIIGQDTIKDFLTVTPQRPVFYFRLASTAISRQTNTVAWMDAAIMGHIFAARDGDLFILKSFADALALDARIIMPDTSPMFLRGIGADSTADPVAVGQLRIDANFGVLRKPVYAQTLMRPYTQHTKGGH